MSLATAATPAQIIAEHVSALREYAQRELVQGDHLSFYEIEDKDRRIMEFVALTSCYKCTAKEQVGLVYQGLFT